MIRKSKEHNLKILQSTILVTHQQDDFSSADFPRIKLTRVLTSYEWICHAYSWYSECLLHFWPMFPFNTPGKHQQTFWFHYNFRKTLVLIWFHVVLKILAENCFSILYGLLYSTAESMLSLHALAYIFRPYRTDKCI